MNSHSERRLLDVAGKGEAHEGQTAFLGWAWSDADRIDRLQGL